MGAGRAAEFDADTTDFGSVSWRSSGPVDAAKDAQKAQQETANHLSDCCILMRNLLSPEF